MHEKHVLLTVRTAEGRRIVTPTGSAVPTAGFQVDPRDPWWARALASGDIVEMNADERAQIQMRADASASKAAEVLSKPVAANQSEAAMPSSSGTVRSEEKN
ncbi:DUF2635 domain-containing protein [Saccharibacter floricola]|uniref:DUF2635 domain-containing protein n=1 Tax=Saccharibacter floricola DSM 15669 TaxID=1123227 RepID=A0ABQ0P1A4_9PROT|nr:DUF2635 domain-containing protein [Saccharibacter floricola]GBQ08935.1 hypothetical protein AA15669_1971 [Saccharibacter floricola DSM 15669]